MPKRNLRPLATALRPWPRDHPLPPRRCEEFNRSLNDEAIPRAAGRRFLRSPWNRDHPLPRRDLKIISRLTTTTAISNYRSTNLPIYPTTKLPNYPTTQLSHYPTILLSQLVMKVLQFPSLISVQFPLSASLPLYFSTRRLPWYLARVANPGLTPAPSQT